MVMHPPRMPDHCASHAVEVARLQWSVLDGGDPAELAVKFLAPYGIAVSFAGPPDACRTDHPLDSTVCGAALFLSAAAGAHMIAHRTRAVAAPTPVPAVPDLVAVVYAAVQSAPAFPDRGPAWTDRGRAPAAPQWALGPWRESWTRAEHAAAVDRVRAAIAAGEVYQVNLVGHASAPYTGDPGPALHRVAALPGARYAGGLAGEGWTIACASPETLVEVRGHRLYTRPIKGTRQATPAGHSELRANAKERAEHVMIVDLERNDVARVARTGTVRVTDLFAVRRWCDLWQAESEVVADLADGVGLADILRAVCPGGSVTGAPKLAALDLIAAIEPVGRGPSMGALGWIGRDSLDLGLTIRTVAADAERVHLWAGGGITWDSDPWAEVDEAWAKSRPVRRALAAPAAGPDDSHVDPGAADRGR
jgi:para-aminobenzoate synthetase component 1